MAGRETTPLRGAWTVSRAVNLTFRITNARQELEEVQKITRAIAHAIMMLRILRLGWKAWLGALGPVGWAMLGVTAATEAYMISLEFTAKEELDGRGPG